MRDIVAALQHILGLHPAHLSPVRLPALPDFQAAVPLAEMLTQGGTGGTALVEAARALSGDRALVAELSDRAAAHVETTRTETISRVDLSMPLMWGNPVVLLAETAPPMTGTYWGEDEGNADVLRMLKSGMRLTATIAHPAHNNSCEPGTEGYPDHLGEAPNRPLWPMGMALWMLAGAGSLGVSTWRLAIPIKRLGAGTRIA